MYVKVHVAAGTRKEKFLKESDTVFIVSVREPAERNFANRRVQELLALHFHTPLSNVRLTAGHHSPQKVFSITLEQE